MERTARGVPGVPDQQPALAAKLASLPYSFSQQMPAPPKKKTQFERNFPELHKQTPPTTRPSLSSIVQSKAAAAAAVAAATAVPPPPQPPQPPQPPAPTVARTPTPEPAVHGGAPKLQGMWDPTNRHRSVAETDSAVAKEDDKAARAHDDDQADLAFLSKLVPTTSATPRPAHSGAMARKMNHPPRSSQTSPTSPTALANGLRTVAPPPLPRSVESKSSPPGSALSLRGVPLSSKGASEARVPAESSARTVSASSSAPPTPRAINLRTPQSSSARVQASSASSKSAGTDSTNGRTQSDEKKTNARSVAPRAPSSPLNPRAAGLRDAIEMTRTKERDNPRSSRPRSGSGEMPQAMLDRRRDISTVSKTSRQEPVPAADGASLEMDETDSKRGQDPLKSVLVSPTVDANSTVSPIAAAREEDDQCTFFLPALGLDDEESVDHIRYDGGVAHKVHHIPYYN